jgi:hypothetical protein
MSKLNLYELWNELFGRTELVYYTLFSRNAGIVYQVSPPKNKSVLQEMDFLYNLYVLLI